MCPVRGDTPTIFSRLCALRVRTLVPFIALVVVAVNITKPKDIIVGHVDNT